MRYHVARLAVVAAVSLVIPAAVHAEDAAEHVQQAKARLDNSTPLTKTADIETALAECDKAVAINPKFAEAYLTRGRAWLFKREDDKAIIDSDKALSLDPKLAEAYYVLANARMNKGGYDKALADSNQALTLDPKLALAYATRAEVWWRMGNRGNALADFERGLKIAPDNPHILNNLGVFVWQEAQNEVRSAAAYEATGDLGAANACRQKSIALKDKARAYWNHGVTANPTDTDIHSNLGYAYSEAGDIDAAERHLAEAVKFAANSPRVRNNLGRVLLRRSQHFSLDAGAAEAKGKTDPVESAKAKQLSHQAKEKLDAAIEQFEKAVELEPSLLEARLNLGEVYTQLGELDKSEAHYRAIEKYEVTLKKNPSDFDALANFGQAHFGLARIAFARGKSDEGIAELKQAIAVNPSNLMAMDRLAQELFLRGKYREGEQVVRKWLIKLPAPPSPARRQLAEQFGKRFEGDGKHDKAVRAWDMMAWIFASSPEPQMRDPQAALGIAEGIVKMTKNEDPLTLDTLAVALAVNDKYPPAVEAAQQAIDLANKQGNKQLAAAIAKRLELYKQGKPFKCGPDDATGRDPK